MTEVLYRGSNEPVMIASSIISRAQSIMIQRDRTLRDVYQLGNVQNVGVLEDPWRYTGRISWYPINGTGALQVERAISGQPGDVTLAHLLDSDGVTFRVERCGLTGAKAESIEYTASVPNGTLTGTLNVRGTGYSDTWTDLTPEVPAGIVGFQPKHIYVEWSGHTTGRRLRVRNLTVRAQISTTEEYEFSNEDPYEIFREQPQVTVDMEVRGNYDSNLPGTHDYDYWPTVDAGEDLEIQFVPANGAWDDDGNIVMKVHNLITATEPYDARVGNVSTRRGSFRTTGENATYGWEIGVIGGDENLSVYDSITVSESVAYATA